MRALISITLPWSSSLQVSAYCKLTLFFLQNQVTDFDELVSRAGGGKNCLWVIVVKYVMLWDLAVGMSPADLAHRFDDGRFCAGIRAELQEGDLWVFWRVFFTKAGKCDKLKKNHKLIYCVADSQKKNCCHISLMGLITAF